MVSDLNRQNRILVYIIAVMTVIVLCCIVSLTDCSAQTSAKPARQCVIETFTAELGVKELTGKNDGFRVEQYLASAGLGKGYAWCAAFVNWTYKGCGITGPESPAWSPSWFPSGKINQGDPLPGDVFGIYFNDKGRIAHVGFILVVNDRSFTTIEGNTNGAGSREGNGVYKKIRLRKQVYVTANWID